ncbi:MAG: hypothetical protein LUG93_06870 [Lachnospiraceae bacterium]|nr:hypothetical protein [Lachnospiraceae bacterium]
MNLFGNSFFNSAPEHDRPPKTGAALYFQVLWDHLGKNLLMNVVCFAAFLPMMLGVSLGLIYENFWLSILFGLTGGAIAAPVWCAFLRQSFHYFSPTHNAWFWEWRQTLAAIWKRAAIQGSLWGLLLSVLLFVGQFFLNVIEEGMLPAPMVWMILVVDFFLFSLATVAFGTPLCFAVQPFSAQLESALTFLKMHPGRIICSALVFLVWYTFWLSMFPVSVPFAVLLAFWPMLLLIAQLQRPILTEQDAYATQESTERNTCAAQESTQRNTYATQESTKRKSSDFSESGTNAAAHRSKSAAESLAGSVPDSDIAYSEGAWHRREPDGKEPLTLSERFEILMRRFWPLVVGILVVLSLGLGALRTILSLREADLSIAFVHSDSLPDNVKSALEKSLEELVGDLNGDGVSYVEINDYEVVFDGSATDSDMQTAGMTLLVTDLSQAISSIYIVEDADGFLALYEDQVDASDRLSWADVPTLAALEAGAYSLVEDISVDHTGQELLAGYAVFPADDCADEILELLLR